MDYALAKALKDAGFVQEGRGAHVLLSEAHQEGCYVPTLEELIEACGADFAMLVHEQNIRMWSARAKGRSDDFFGPSPAAAVARLWLARPKNMPPAR
jgi:hypothetical protein